ncbi:putative cell wall proline rich protein [Aspergillus aculeatinus CBS 121060]|uniref:Cell wall proline rich protein n=1 Tax=Aspergillus aculeatinus CBS 121060 TaxID=1448322 RepID=A0ACD1GUE9_9EURO|nr:cell wall proline rich protein [Aspergillus aculeatinus CBS 121060]RAH65083.1 cell wall proline rich protein [Aspergillus aculeatinus CBS 121060]
MASISLPPQHPITPAFSEYLRPIDRSPVGHSRRNLTMSTPLPNPPFVFPARDPGDTASEAPATRRRTPPPLPAFSFNPGSNHSAQPSMPNLSMNRPGGHRRRCSEFAIQGNDESSASTPVKLPAPGPGFGAGSQGKRRHAHRRSAAISSPTVESAPCMPADPMREHHASDEPTRPASQSAAILYRNSPPASPRIVVETEPPTPVKSSDETTIPSPCYTSPEKSPKFLAPTSASDPDFSTRNSGVVEMSSAVEPKLFSNEKPKPRPRTADASLMLDQHMDSAIGDTSSLKRPLSAAGHSRNRKSFSSGILDHFAGSSRRSSSSSNTGSTSDTSDRDARESSDSFDTHKRISKAKKRQKKVRSWAGAILTRGKAKRHAKKDMSENIQPSVPAPVITRTNSDLGSGLDVDFDDDTIVVIRTPTNPATPDARRPTSHDSNVPSLEHSWKPRSFYEQTTQNDALSPVIDLDAALGPFNTPDMHSGRVAESGFSAATKRMYSGGRRGEFVGPEMRYHRRAESAPEMPPFDRSFLGNNRFVNTSTLENPDVLYEEEEDAFLAATSESPAENIERPLSQVIISTSRDDAESRSEESKSSSETLTAHPVVDEVRDQPHTGLGIQETETHIMSTADATSSIQEDLRPRTASNPIHQLQNAGNPFSNSLSGSVDVAEQEAWQHRMPVPTSPDVSPRFMAADTRPTTSPMELTYNIPPLSLQGSTLVSNSSFPSPDFTGCSSDAPRSIKTPSTSDHNFSNPSYNTSMDLPQTSVEDVPSLTSSASTTTNTPHRFSGTFFGRPRLSSDRSASFSEAVRRRTSRANSYKRSSLASLSKLVVGSQGEKSKLSHEEKPPEDEPEKSKRKSHRISRLMHFWRSKDKDRPHEHGVRQEPQL